mgnify:CR=1 FL=1
MNIESIVEDFYNVPNKLRKHKNQIKMNQVQKNIAIQIMDIEQMLDDEIGANGLPLSNEDADILYSEIITLLHRCKALNK